MTLTGKSELRASALALRDALPVGGAAAMAGHLARYLAGERFGSAGGYWPIGSEIDPRPSMLALASAGARLALPEAGAPASALEFRLWSMGDELVAGRYGTLHPRGEAVLPELLLVPLLAFDRRGHRLGYGGGYYDRTLAAWPAALAVGCGYAAQELDEIPAGPHDVRLHAIATETGVIDIRKR